MLINIYDSFSIILIIIISFFILKSDIKFKKIKNGVLVNGFFVGLVLLFLGLIFGGLSLDYLFKVLVNTLISSIVVYLFWYFSFWPAGDAKLFILFSFIVPLHFYYNWYLPLFPSLMLLINIFIPIFLFIILQSFLYMYQNMMYRHISLFNVVSRILAAAKSLNYSALFKRNKIFSLFKNLPYKSILIILIIIYTGDNEKSIVSIVKKSILSILLYSLLFWMVKKHISDKEWYNKPLNEIEKGSVFVNKTKDGELFNKVEMNKIGKIRSDGMNDNQVEIIKNILKSKNIKNIVLQKNFAFSPWIFLGVILTIILQDSLLRIIISLLK